MQYEKLNYIVNVKKFPKCLSYLSCQTTALHFLHHYLYSSQKKNKNKNKKNQNKTKKWNEMSKVTSSLTDSQPGFVLSKYVLKILS